MTVVVVVIGIELLKFWLLFIGDVKGITDLDRGGKFIGLTGSTIGKFNLFLLFSHIEQLHPGIGPDWIILLFKLTFV